MLNFLYLILDDGLCPPQFMVEQIKQLLDSGITCVQLRMKQPSELLEKLGRELLNILKTKKVPLIINDHIEIAAKIDVDGVHIGQKDMPYADARKYLGYEGIGLSVENLAQAKQCQQLDVDYFGIGPVFATKTKIDAANPMGIQQLKANQAIT